MADLDLTPDLSLPTAAQEVVLPSTVNSDTTNQPVGGFMASPGALTSGNITFNGTNEQILVGAITAPDAGKGVFIGNPGDGTYDFFAGDSTGHFIWWDASTNTLTVNADVSVTDLNIPDTTTASSFHTDADGNSWWGANVASGLAAAAASITADGAAVFKKILIGGASIQYEVTNAGMFTFGDGSDGAVTISADTTLTSDKYYTDLTVNSGKVLNPNGYRIFVSGTLTVNGTIARNGNDGSGSSGGAALPDGYLKGSLAGGNGASSGGGGDPGAGTANSLGSDGVSGANGSTGQLGGAGGTVTPSNVKLIANWHLATLLDISSSGSTVKFNNSASAGGGGAGGNSLTFGGGAGSAGGIVAIYARNIVIGAAGAIQANGGHGADGRITASQGGGGGGGNGGILILVYNTLTNAGSLSAAAGLGGNSAANGAAGSIYQFQVSL